MLEFYLTFKLINKLIKLTLEILLIELHINL